MVATSDCACYYEAVSGGGGWSDEELRRCNTQAFELDSMAELLAGVDAEDDELLEQLRMVFHQTPQTAIDEELFDVIAGFEALSSEK